jgi:tetratricopeptide (TPR) repeat protein
VVAKGGNMKKIFYSLLLLIAACDDADKVVEQTVIVDDTPSGNFLAGFYAAQKYNMEDAANFYAQVVKMGEKDPEFLRTSFSLFTASGNIDEATEYAKSFLKTNPQNSIANLVMFAGSLGKDDVISAQKYLDNVEPKNFDKFLKPALSSWLAAYKKNEVAAFSANEEIKPLFANFYFYNKALLYEYFGKSDEALKIYTMFTKSPVVSSRVGEVIANFFARRGEYKQAQNILNNLKIGRNSIIVRHLLDKLGEDILNASEGKKVKNVYSPLITSPKQAMAEAFLTMLDFAGGLKAFDAAILYAQFALHFNPNIEIAKIFYAEIMDLRGVYNVSNKIYSSFDIKSPFYYYANLRLASNLIRVKKLEEAEKVYKKIIKAFPGKVEAYIDLANLYKAQKEYKDALSNYNIAIELLSEPTGDDWVVFYNRGLMFDELKEYDKAEQDFLTALKISPQNYILLNHMGYSWIERGKNITQGINMIKLAIEKAPNDANIIDSLGWAYFIQGMYKQAVEKLEIALTKDNSNSIINDHLGDAYFKIGRKLEAQYQWKKALFFNNKDGLLKNPEKIKQKIDAEKI